jgi:hypothetical protein
MTQALCAHMNNKTIKIKKKKELLSWELCTKTELSPKHGPSPVELGLPECGFLLCGEDAPQEPC